MNSSPQKNSLTLPEYSVSELSYHLKNTVESKFPYVFVRGEISGYRGIHASGHAYFSLKDNKSRIDAVIWKGTLRKIEHPPEEGIEFLALGKITTFPGSSKYQIIIESLIPSGSGALMTILEERKKKLREEEIFSDKYKNPIPFMPKNIAVITSPTGAVIRDILQRISCRFPVRVILFPAKVQGDECPREIVNAIIQLNGLKEESICPRPDIIILARGGGSIEDLWHFNDETLVRAIANSSIPIISAIGHETDWTLSDYAADLRAPTPTGAAEMAVPVKHLLISSLKSLESRLNHSIVRLAKNKVNCLNSLIKILPNSDQILSCPRYQLDRLSRELEHNLEIIIFRKCRYFNNTIIRIKSDVPMHNIQKYRQNIIKKQEYIEHQIEQYLRCIHLKTQQKGTMLHMLCEQTKSRITHFHAHIKDSINRIELMLSYKIQNCHTSISTPNRILKSLAHRNILKRGYSTIRDLNNNLLTKTNKLSAGTNILIDFFEGQASAIITNKNHSVLPIEKKYTRKRKDNSQKKKKHEDQGSLF